LARVVACRLTGATGLEPAASGVTVRRTNPTGTGILGLLVTAWSRFSEAFGRTS
jgi:hypothetical protein